MNGLITYQYELDENDWVAKRGDKVLCRISEEYVNSLANVRNCTPLEACKILLGEIFLDYFSYTDGIAERQIIRMIFH